MLWAGNKARPRDLYIGSRVAAWCDGAGEAVRTSVEGMEAGVAWARAQLTEDGYNGKLRVWLSGGLCRPFLMPELPGVSAEEEILRVATRLAGERTGLPGDCKVWLDRARHGEARVGVAVLQETIGSLHGTLGVQWRIDAIQPWWTEVLRIALSHPDAPLALGTQDCDSLTILIGKNSGFSMATTISPVVDEASADSAFTRALLSADVVQGRDMLVRLGSGASSSPELSGAALGTLMEFPR